MSVVSSSDKNSSISPSVSLSLRDTGCQSLPAALKRSGTTPCRVEGILQGRVIEPGRDISELCGFVLYVYLSSKLKIILRYASSFNTDTTIADTLSNFANIEYKVLPGLVSSMAIKRKEQETKNAIKLLKDIEKELKHVDGKVDKTFTEETAGIISDGKRICGKKRKSKLLVKATGMVTDVVQAYNGTIWASACQNNESVIIYLGHIDQEFHPEIVLRLPRCVICMKAIGKYIWVGTKSEFILLFDADHPSAPQKRLLGHTAGPVNTIVGMPLQELDLNQTADVYPVPMNGVVFTAAGDLTINVWNISTLELVHTIKTVSDPVCSLCVTGAGDLWIATTRGIMSCQVFKNYKIEPVDMISYLSYKRTDGAGSDSVRPREKQYDAFQKEHGCSGALGSHTPSKLTHNKTSLAVPTASHAARNERQDANAVDEKDLRNIITMEYLNGEVWGCSHTAIICWEYETKKRIAVYSVPFVSRLAVSGRDVFGFSLFGIYAWNAKKQPKVFSSEPASSGLLAGIGNEIKIIAGLIDGKIASFQTKSCVHTLVPTVFSDQCFCCVCHKSLRVGTRSGFACTTCASFKVHSSCLPFVKISWACSGKSVKKVAQESASHPLMAPISTQSKVKPSPEMIAKSLLAISPKTDPAIIGDWLGSPGNEQVVKAWIGSIGVAALNFEMALRKFWSSLLVPDESEKRERLLRVFGNTYFDLSHNSFFSCGDACYSLASSCVFLNSRLHSNDSSGTVSQERWIVSNEGLNCDWSDRTKNVIARDFDKGLLSFLYCQIKDMPLQFAQSPVTLMQGRLAQKDKVVFCRLTEDSFSVFKKQDFSPLASYKLSDLRLSISQESTSFVLVYGADEQRLTFTPSTKFKAQMWTDAFKVAKIKILA